MGQFVFEREIATATERGLRWLVESFRVNGYEGSSAWSSRVIHPGHGWSLPYPETTGYIIPTLYAGRARYPQLAKFAPESIGSRSRTICFIVRIRRRSRSSTLPRSYGASSTTTDKRGTPRSALGSIAAART